MRRNILIRVLHGRIGNILWRVESAHHYASKRGMDIILYAPDRKSARYYEEVRHVMFPNMEYCTKLPDDVKIDYEWKEPMKWSHAYVPIPDFPQGSNILLWGAAEDPRYLPGIRIFLPHVVQDEAAAHYDGELPDSYVSINVRRGDKLHLQERYVIPSSKWIRMCMEKSEGQDFVFTSDDMDWCRREFGHDSRCYFADKPHPWKQFIDLWLASNRAVRHNIISNSTFSWWGAYLNTSNTRRVFYDYPFDKTLLYSFPVPEQEKDRWELVVDSEKYRYHGK